jgi:hypothetical protein
MAEATTLRILKKLVDRMGRRVLQEEGRLTKVEKSFMSLYVCLLLCLLM